ncbi:hypothetical protein ACMGGR_08130 [Erwinia sp. BNK-24-b]|uniref:hypothetical protein n=1 Tax=Erwinia TaxID=551 RepID=UPI001FEE69E8|nr:hypothetical protein [Erwinia phyllosphaerae]MBV4365109.1 hypothetical protein [Erwinia phyllosphaerae]
MKTLIISDTVTNLKKIDAALTDNACLVTGYYPQEADLSPFALISPNLHEAVAESENIVISLESDKWDEVILGLSGILTRVSEETKIISYTRLAADKLKIYSQFLSSKNLVFVDKS